MYTFHLIDKNKNQKVQLKKEKEHQLFLISKTYTMYITDTIKHIRILAALYDLRIWKGFEAFY